jgi:hypothetical protein
MNAFWFQLGVIRDVDKWDPATEALLLARIISSPLGVVKAGCFIAFTPSK